MTGRIFQITRKTEVGVDRKAQHTLRMGTLWLLRNSALDVYEGLSQKKDQRSRTFR